MDQGVESFRKGDMPRARHLRLDEVVLVQLAQLAAAAVERAQRSAHRLQP